MNLTAEFRPKLLDTLKSYTRADFHADIVAGITVGIVALPLAMAFAIASGVPPQAGIFTAVIAGILISGLGGTKVSIGVTSVLCVCDPVMEVFMGDNASSQHYDPEWLMTDWLDPLG